MALENFVWKITGIRKANGNDLNNIIIGTTWTVTATESGTEYSGTFTGATPFDLTTVDPDNFTPYNELTEAQVLSWIKSVASGSNESNPSVPSSYWGHITERIQKQIDEQKYTIENVMEMSLPWSGSAE
jgi:hypothetical protein